MSEQRGRNGADQRQRRHVLRPGTVQIIGGGGGGGGGDTGLSLLQDMDFWLSGADDIRDGQVGSFPASSGQTIEIGSDDADSDTNDPVLAQADTPAWVTAVTDEFVIHGPEGMPDGETADVTIVGEIIVGDLSVSEHFYYGTSNNSFFINTSKVLVFQGTAVGSGNWFPGSSNVIDVAEGDHLVAEAVLDLSAGSATYRYKVNGSDWISAGTASGAGTSGTEWTGRTAYIGHQSKAIRTTITYGATTLMDFQASEFDSAGWTDANGDTWTVTGTATHSPASNDGFFLFHGVAGNYLSVADPGHGDDFEYEIQIVRGSTDTITSVLGSQYEAGTNESWILQRTATLGSLQFYYSADGSTLDSVTFTGCTVDQTGGWLKLTRDKATGSINCYQKVEEGDSYSLFYGPTVRLAGSALYNSTEDFKVGQYSAATRCFHGIGRVRLRHGIGTGSYVVDIDASNAGHKTFTDEVGNTVTVNRTTTAGEACTAWVPPSTGWSIHDDTDDWLEFTDASFERAANGEFTLVIGAVFNNPDSADVALIGHTGGGDGRLILQYDKASNTAQPKLWLTSGVGTATAEDQAFTDLTALTNGDFVVIAMRFATDGTVTMYQSIDGAAGETSSTTVAAAADESYLKQTTNALKIGLRAASSWPWAGSIASTAANYDTALTDAQLDLIADYLNDIYNPAQT